MTDVTAAIVAYNGERYYVEAIESLLGQTHPVSELLLVVDGASTDRTVEIAQGYAERDTRVRVIEVPHCNIATKMARAVTEATGEWVAFLDSDDIALPHRVERCLTEAAERPEVVAWFGWTWNIRADGRRLRILRHGPTDEEQFAALRREHDIPIFAHGTGLFRREALLAAGNYDPGVSIATDYDIVDRLCDVGVMLTIPEPLMEYRVHSDNTSFKNFALQSTQFEYLWQRRAAKDRGESYPSLEEFIAQPPSEPRLRRYFRGTRDRSRFYASSASRYIAGGHWGRALWAAARSILWNPRSVARRVWRNQLGPKLRQRRWLGPFFNRRSQRGAADAG